MSAFDNWDRQTEESFDEKATHFGGPKKGKVMANLTPKEEKSVRDRIDKQLMGAFKQLEVQIKDQRTRAYALQAMRTAMQNFKISLFALQLKPNESAAITEFFGRNMLFCADEVKRIVEGRNETAGPKGN